MFLRTLREDLMPMSIQPRLLQRAGYIRKAAPIIWTGCRSVCAC